MSEEEKKAIETLKEVASDDFDTLGDDISPKMAQNILNVINKQQKEIEKIKDKNKTLEGLLQGNLFELYLYYKELASKYQANSISKDKIKKFIKDELPDDEEMELCTIVDVNGIELRKKLEELLEEN